MSLEPKTFSRKVIRSRRSRRGIALILVLACLVLLVVMVLAFLGSIGNELQASKFYANGSSVKLLAQSTTDLVMAEIRDATSSGTLAWASQPGMIRTFDTSGNVVKYYKLYSDDSMITSTFDHTVALVPSGTNAWYNQPGVYVDLNQPVSVTVSGSNTNLQYPIVDGNIDDYTATKITTSAGVGKILTTTPLPPIIKPTSSATANLYCLSATGTGSFPAVSGFWVNGNTPVDTSHKANNLVPMPVKWLYVLKDGNIAVPDSATTAGSTTVNFSNSAAKPSVTNPIVGRMAFWTDDETCKVNVNTASEGTYWDIPRAQSPGDTTLAQNSPVKYEYQRYPGHPAMTSLSTVLSLNGTGTSATESIYQIAPRLGTGGSLEGTQKTTEGATFTVSTNSNRLYSTVDEYLFQPALSGTARLLNSAISSAPAITPAAIKIGRFFLTANSRAPDVNLFNQPRISIWPISISNGSISHSMSSFDKLIAFCSSMRTDLATPYLYYFQRTDPTDPNVDLPSSGNASVSGLGRNRMLLSYLRNRLGSPVPGFSSSSAVTFAAKYNSTNPNLAGSTDKDQILTEIFDYIRSTNLGDPSVPNADPYTFTYSAINYNGTPAKSAGNGKGEVVPIEDTDTATHGFGRFRMIQGATIVFIANVDGSIAASQPKTQGSYTPVAADSVRIQMCFLPQFFDPSPGSIFDVPSFDYTITGLDGFSMGATSASALTNAGLPSNFSSHQAYYPLDNAFWGDQYGFKQALSASFAGPNAPTFCDISRTAGNGSFYFSGGTISITVKTSSNSSSYLGASCTSPGKIIQTGTLTFPSGTFTLPSLAPSNVYDYQYATSTGTGPYNMRYFNAPPTLNIPNVASGPDLPGNNSPSLGGRFSAGSITAPYVWFTKYDVIRSVAIASDPRLVAAQKYPPSSLFSPVGPYNSGGTVPTNTYDGTHTFFDGAEIPFFGGIVGRLVSGANYDSVASFTSANGGLTANQLLYASSGSTGGGGTIQSTQPGGRGDSRVYYNYADCFDPNTGKPINGVAMGKTSSIGSSDVPGDWDNGISVMRDGPFINKADEGDSGGSYFPYDWKGRVGYTPLSTGLFTPNRMIPSAVMFGSLPTGVYANKPWQTLLFRPGPIGHTGLGTSATTPKTPTTTYGNDQGPPYNTLPDHLFLDLFSMPVVEPYAISEPLSTAGRINMNQLIVPFNYINRDTGLRAVLKSEQVVTMLDSMATLYKYSGGATTYVTRYPVNVDATLAQFYTRRFNNNDIFRSPSEICDIDIVPSDSAGTNPMTTSNYPNLATGITRGDMDKYWGSTSVGHRLTGDNSREKVYATIYPRLTTKSNTFTIHFRVQTLKPALAPTSATGWDTWREGTDVVTSEYRGSQTIERYVDPNDSTLVDFADPANYNATLAPYYRFRVLSTKQFTP